MGTTQTGLVAAFTTIAFFTTVGMMIRLPLRDWGGKAVIQYLTLGLLLLLGRSAMEDRAMAAALNSPEWWPMVVGVFAVGFVLAPIVSQAEALRKDVTVKTVVAALLILFCMGGSYIASASVSMVSGLRIPWYAASFALAVLLRNTTELDEEEFPDAQMETFCQLCLFISAAALVIPV